MLAMAEEDNLYESYIVLQYRNKAMQRELESFRDGTRYKKLQEDHRRVIAGYIKENRSLRQELADAHLRAEWQYGVGVQALALSLMNTTNAAINKVPTLLEGLTGSEIVPSEGYIAKL